MSAIEAISVNVRAGYARKKIYKQFGKTPEHRLMFAVFESGLIDYVNEGKRRAYNIARSAIIKSGKNPDNISSAMVNYRMKRTGEYHLKRAGEAYRYLEGDILHAEVCGVDSAWIRLVLRKCELI